MDLTTRRHGLLTANLANVNTPEYKRQDMDFATDLEAAESGMAEGENLSKFRSEFGMGEGESNSIRIDGNSVDLETEVMSIAEMEYRYQMLSEMTNRYFSGLKTAIKEGR